MMISQFKTKKILLVLFLLEAILARLSTAFSPSVVTKTSKSQHINTKLAVAAAPAPAEGGGANPNTIVQDDDAQGVTPNQIKVLRKELSKRQARKILALESYVSDEGENEEEIQNFLSSVCSSLEENELVQVRGVSIDNKREVYDTAHRLAYDLSVELQREVTVVVIKGYAVTYYCPSSDPTKRKITLRTSYKEGAWTRREKALRDHRGQIIRN